MNKSNISDKMSLNERNTKNKFSKTNVNKYTDKKSILEMNKNGKIPENSYMKKTLEDKNPLDFNKTLAKDNKKVTKVGILILFI